MPTIKAKELREKTDQELLDQMANERKRLFDATVRGSTGEAIKPHEKRAGKRLIAKIQTLLRERALRQGLAARVKELEGQAQGAGPEAARLAARAPRPALGRVALRTDDALTPADRAAVRLAEAKRLQAALVRTDPGQTR